MDLADVNGRIRSETVSQDLGRISGILESYWL